MPERVSDLNPMVCSGKHGDCEQLGPYCIAIDPGAFFYGDDVSSSPKSASTGTSIRSSEGRGS